MKCISNLLVITLCVLCCSCVVFMRKDFKRKHQTALFPVNTEVYDAYTSKVKFDGYYYLDEIINGQLADVMFTLYPDGTYLGYIFKEDERGNIGKSVTNLNDFTAMPEKLFYGGGIYTIDGDTLIIDYYHHEMGLCWELTIYKFEIIDCNTLRQFEIKWINTLAGATTKRMDDIYRFTQASPQPSPFEAKSKSKKWMWKNKADWKAYKKELDEYLEQKKAKNRELKE